LQETTELIDEGII
jgi:hypothetical protein